MKVTKLNYENFVIDYIEGELEPKQKIAFDKFLLAHPEVQKEINEYLAAPILPIEENIVYENKASLRKRKAFNPWIILSIAALFLITFGIFFFNTKTEATSKLNHITTEENNNTTKYENVEKLFEQKTDEIDTNSNSKNLNDKNSKLELVSKKETESKKVRKHDSDFNAGFMAQNVEPKSILETELPIKHNAVSLANTIEETNQVLVANTEVNPSKSIQIETNNNTDLIPINTISRLNVIDQKFEIENRAIATIDIDFQKVNRPITENKNPFWDLIKPAAYEDLNLKDAVAVSSKPENRNILKTIAPRAFTK